jgi:HAD superfamily hydrolase (TIGR01509 family)
LKETNRAIKSKTSDAAAGQFSAIIFDMDGLMFDTEQIAQYVWEQAAEQYGYPAPNNAFLGVIGKARPDVEIYTRQIFGEEFPFDSVYHRKQQLLREHLVNHGVPLKPGIIELLDWLEEQDIVNALASSSPCAVILGHLEQAEIDSTRFTEIVGGDEVERGKPAPDIFLLAAAKLRIPAAECIVIEDSNAGIHAAHKAGMLPLMVPDLIPPTEETKRLAYRIFSNLHDVRNYLAEW